MSTKTTLKRIALVAVASLGFGLLAVVPAKAAAIEADTADIAGAPYTNATIATTGTVSTRLAFVDGATGDTVSMRLLQSGTDAATAFTWRVLEHSSNLVINKYYGDSSETFTVKYPTTPPTAGSPAYLLVQVGTVGATATNTVKLQASDDAFTSVGDKLTVTVTAAGSGTTPPSSTNTVDTPWRINDSYTGETTTVVSVANLAAMTATSVVATTTNDVRIKSAFNTVAKPGSGSFRYVEVTGSTIKAVAGGMVLDGTANSATRAFVGTDGVLSTTSEVHINATTAGTVTVKFIDRSQAAITGAFYDTVLQTITYTVSAAGAVSGQQSKAYIHGLHSSTNGIATDDTSYTGAYDADFSTRGDLEVLALATANGTTPKAVIQVQLKDATGVAVLPSALPAIAASVVGVGTISISSASQGAGGVASQGVSLSATAAPSATFYINVFSDGIAGSSKINISVAGSAWDSKELTFYSPTVAKIEATQGRFVLAATETAAGCDDSEVPGTFTGTVLEWCNGSTVARSVATSIRALDANNNPVPFVTYTETSSDATVFTGNATANTGDYRADYLGTTWFEVPVVANTTSGKSATMTYTAGTLTQVLTFSIGGAPATASLAIAAGANVGEKGKFTVTVKDASGNPIADSDHSLAVTSNLYLVIPASSALPVKSGSASVDFWNPTVPGTVNVTGLISGVLPVSGSFSVSNASVDAAADAAAEAIDAANAATDAANLAAEAADAATVAAEEARDAADAATAAVEELATQVATLMAALKAQITTLANTVAKIAKKVKA